MRPKRNRRWSSIAATSALLFGLGFRLARAQNAEAEALFNDGDKLMEQGKVAQACDAFEASNRIEPRAGTLIRLGACREQNHQLASAWSAYKDALTRVKDPKKQKIASAKVAELEPKLSHLTVSVPDASQVDGLTLTRNGKPLDQGLWSRALPIDGGEYVIVAQAPGHRDWRTTVKVPVERGNVSVAVHKLEEETKPVPPVSSAPIVDRGEPAAEPPPSAFTTKRKIAIGVGVIGAAAIVTGALLGTSANHQEDEAYALCPDPMQPCADADGANALIDAAKGRALGANIAFGVGGAAMVGAAILWLTGSPEVPARGVSVLPRGDGATVVVTGRF